MKNSNEIKFLIIKGFELIVIVWSVIASLQILFKKSFQQLQFLKRGFPKTLDSLKIINFVLLRSLRSWNIFSANILDLV